MHIRTATDEDHAAITAVLSEVFETEAEARLVKTLRAAQADTLELVALEQDDIVGTVLFSPVEARYADGREVYGLGLAPLAVRPAHQGRGIGSALVDCAIESLTPLGVPFCVVLGEPNYYSRFGFSAARDHVWFWDKDPTGSETGDAFQLLRWRESACPPGPALVHYHPGFDAV
ncbi:GNAT family N-acetyltransferase [Maricaulis sp. D1M11]|uniref:GNAT family N-acetyltransferase n=1 Tax=Maricaulis sp. D1M11 TaxID=3076117 RepID=UPI0039B5B376